jgi:hypothetical protein
LYALAVAQLPSRLAGLIYTGGIKHPTIILEIVASHDRWIWHAFFEVVGSNNDINVLNQFPLFVDVIRGRTPEVSFTVNGREHHIGILSRRWYISLLTSIRERCPCSSTREASILLNEASIGEERCGV